MARSRKFTPSYLKHHNGQGRIVWTDAGGVRQYKLLPGAFNSPESLAAFHRLALELATRPAAVPRAVDAGPSVAEILLPYFKHAEGYYTDAAELAAIRAALRAVRELYGPTPVADFGPKALAAAREAFVRKGWSRQYVNRQCGRVIRCFRWAAAEELCR